MKTIKVGKIYCGGPWSPASKIVFDPVNYAAVTIEGKEVKTLKVEGSLLKQIDKVVRNITGYGFSEKEEKEMLDLFKEFKDWLDYNHPGVKPEPLQEDLMKIALRNWDTKIPKIASKAILKELAKLIVTGN